MEKIQPNKKLIKVQPSEKVAEKIHPTKKLAEKVKASR